MAALFLASQPAGVRRPSPRGMRGGTSHIQHSATGPFLLNDPTYVEAARIFAERIIKAQGEDLDRLDLAFRLALARPPSKEEIGVLQNLLEKERAIYAENEKDALAFLQTGEKPADANLEPVELAAWTSIARVILNLHETITRN